MILPMGLSLLAVGIAIAGLWAANEITTRVIKQTNELINDHAIAIERKANQHGIEVVQLKSVIASLNTETQVLRREIINHKNTHKAEIMGLDKKFDELIERLPGERRRQA